MKVLAGIPTRLRDTSGPIADILAEVVDEVFVVSQGATVRNKSGKVNVVERSVNYGLIPARNEILLYAIKNEFDVVLECDDDLKFSPEIVEIMVDSLLQNPTVGTISSSSRAYFNWNKDVECTKPFLISPCPAQLWGTTVDKVKEVGLMDIDYLEDREYGLRMWIAGYASMLLHTTIQQTHNPFIARTTKTETSGGQAYGIERYEKLGLALTELQSRYRGLVTLKQSPYDVKGRTFSSRYNWNELLQIPVKRFGFAMGYEDSKGRRL